MKIGGRDIGTIARAATETRHYVAALNMFRVYERPLDAFRRYLFGSGSYPVRVGIRTKAGRREITCHSRDDLLTINEIFCRHDYASDPKARVIVDFGSNIGISAMFFLTESPNAYLHLYEPLRQNSERLRENLRGYEDRYTMNEVAVALADGEAEFGWEPSGRYGGIGMPTGRTIRVPCVEANRVLREIIAAHGGIDVLKIDIEALEVEITRELAPDVRSASRLVIIEMPFHQNPMPKTHSFDLYGKVSTLRALRPAA